MNEITAITAQKKDKTRCNIYLDGRFCCGLTVETVVKNRLKVGQTIDGETLSQMQLDSEKNTAFDKALTHLSATRKTEKQIRQFLSRKGYLPNVQEFVVQKLKEYQFIDDSEYAGAYVESSLKRKGSRLVRMELKQKGLADEEIDAAFSSVDEEQELATAKRILEKYMRGKALDKNTRQKAYRHLLSKGFDADTVKEAIDLLCEGQVCDEEE